MEALKEMQKKIDATVKRLKESNQWLRDEDEMTRNVARQDQLLIRNLGEVKAATMAHRMFESNRMMKSARHAIYDMEDQGLLREASSPTAFQALMRLGVHELVADAWGQTPVVWDSVISTQPSSTWAEPYANTFGPEMPEEMGYGDEYSDQNMIPLSKIVINVKIGRALKVFKELLDDDQTSQIRTKSSQIGKRMALYNEVAFAAYLSDAAITQGGLKVTPETYTDPDTTTGIYVTSGNRQNAPSSDGSPTPGNVDVGLKLLKLIKDTNGNIVMVDPNCIVYEPSNWYPIQQIFTADNYLSTPDGSTGSITANPVMGTKNPFKGMLTPYECRFLKAGTWYIGEAKNPMALNWQEREGLQVLQESPDAGESFSRDLYVWKARKRGKMFWMAGGSRFWFRGHA